MDHNINTIIFKIIITGHKTPCRNDFIQLIMKKKCACGDDNQTYYRLFKMSDSMYVKIIIHDIKNINNNMEYTNESDCLLYFIDENVNFLNNEDEKTLTNIHNKNNTIYKYLLINKISEKKRNDAEYIIYLKKIMSSCNVNTCYEMTNDNIEIEKMFNMIMKTIINKRNENNIKFKANYISFPFNIVPVINVNNIGMNNINTDVVMQEEIICIDEKSQTNKSINVSINKNIDIPMPEIEIKKQQPEIEKYNNMYLKSINELEVKDANIKEQIIINLPQTNRIQYENDEISCCCFL